MSGARTVVTPLAVVGLGLVTPSGPTASATCCALRAGIPRFAPLPRRWLGALQRLPEPIVGAAIPGGAGSEPGAARLAGHAVRALREALDEAALHGRRGKPSRLYVGHDPDVDPTFLLRALDAEMPVGREAAVAIAGGRAAALAALAQAADDLAAGAIGAAVVGGVDSLVEAFRLEALHADGLLMTEPNQDGIIPGEAAGFVVLEPAGAAAQRGAVTYATLTGVAAGDEPTAGSEEPCQGDGLGAVLGAALASGAPPGGRRLLPLVVCDLNGDRYRALEWGLASGRALQRLEGPTRLWHPADCLGDVGAASGAVTLAWAATALRRGYADAADALVWGAADGPERAAALLLPAEAA